MALISVITPNATQPKKDTWDKIAQSIEVINGVLGTGINAAKVYNDFENTGINREMVGLKKDELNIERQKTAVGLLDKLEQAKPDDPNAFEFDINSITNPGTARDPAAPKSFFRVKPQEIDPNDFFDNISKGHMKIITNPADAADLKIKGFPVSDVRVKGLPSGIQVALDPEQIKKNLGLANKKAETDIAKTEAETAKILNEKNDTSNKDVDTLFTQRSNSIPFKAAQQVNAVVRQLTDIEKNPSGASDLALITVFNKSLDPTSRVTASEIESAASTGSFGQQVKAAYERFRSGEQLEPQQRADLLAAAKRLVAAHQISGVQNDLGFIREAQQRNIDPSRVIREYDWTKSEEILKKANSLAPEMQMIQSFGEIFMPPLSDIEKEMQKRKNPK
jgi:hypothetical protein